MNNLVEYKDNGPVLPSFAGWEERVGVGKGRSYGLELMVQKKTGRFNGWVGYTLSWSDRWFPDGTVNKGHRFHLNMTIGIRSISSLLTNCLKRWN